jgi:hypothetical protein
VKKGEDIYIIRYLVFLCNMTLYLEGVPMIQRNRLKGEKETTRIISLIGDKADDITQFIARVFSMDNQVLVVDLSSEKKILVNAAGNDKESTINLRRICFTVDEEIYLSRGYEFDVVLFYSDGTREITPFMQNSDYLYLCFGMQRYSMFLLERMFPITNLTIPYALVWRGVEDKKIERMAEDLYLMLSANKAKAERVYYAPICEKDISGLVRLDSNGMVLTDLSNGMQELVIEATGLTDRNMVNYSY